MNLLMVQAGSDAGGTLLGDATGISVMWYGDQVDAKSRLVSRL